MHAGLPAAAHLPWVVELSAHLHVELSRQACAHTVPTSVTVQRRERECGCFAGSRHIRHPESASSPGQPCCTWLPARFPHSGGAPALPHERAGRADEERASTLDARERRGADREGGLACGGVERCDEEKKDPKEAAPVFDFFTTPPRARRRH